MKMMKKNNFIEKKKMPTIRIFQIAKELNISHTDIISFLDSKGVDIKKSYVTC